MFSKILIANRGAIACRVIRTLRTMNIKSVAIYASVDADSLHVQLADEAYCLGDGGARETYLNQQKIIDIMQQSGAQAVHPGYGFLSENAQFVALCEQHHFIFIGPDSVSMQAFALKHKARELAEKFSVPLVPGSDLMVDKSSALEAAKNIGFPIILKSTAGGGGIGMQICNDAETLLQAFDSVVRLSENNFSNGGVFIEKYISQARHIEVQVFGNGLGQAVHFGERDCSLQRRNQKVIEESPAPHLHQITREKMHQVACDLLAGVNYANAGTVEFIFDKKTHEFYFLEVNTRLQVEHGVTEEIFDVDLVQWMIEQAYQPIKELQQKRAQYHATGHAIQARIYAENPAKQFLPSAGLLSEVNWAKNISTAARLRIDTWISAGLEVPSAFDPMLAKVIVWAPDREQARRQLQDALSASSLYGIETNKHYVQQLLDSNLFKQTQMHTRSLEDFCYTTHSLEVLTPGTLTTIQDLPGRLGYWQVGVPPSGPFDSLSFSLGNRLLNNVQDAAGLEITLNGPSLRFYAPTQIIVTGAAIELWLDDVAQEMYRCITIAPKQILRVGKIKAAGVRAYILFKGGLQCPAYLGSRATFALGQFGGHCGRALKSADILHFAELQNPQPINVVPHELPKISHQWLLHVIYGPHGAPDFFTQQDIQTFFTSEWEVHYNSSRTGIRLIGPKPEWARSSGGEAGMHPSNIHDNAYAFGSVDFTGDMPVILGPDGPSLGGFVCPATVVHADLWKLGQLKAGDKIRFQAVSIDNALHLEQLQLQGSINATVECASLADMDVESCIYQRYRFADINYCVRLAGDRFVLLEIGEQVLDLKLRFQVEAVRSYLLQQITSDAQLAQAIIDLTPGIRSLQIHYDPQRITLKSLVALLNTACQFTSQQQSVSLPSRTLYLPLSWDDEVCQQAIEKYMQSVRKDAPWCPSNLEFIRRINGLDSIAAVKQIVFAADYVVMGLGDVYLGAPVATPLDPRHRLVTTKYNPARTWTAENSVGIGGAYLCIYGMEGPGGYQFIGRTLQMWNRYKKTTVFSQPWLLRFFDKIKFFEVSSEELKKIRQDFIRGDYTLRIEQGNFSLAEYQNFIAENETEICAFEKIREHAFAEELKMWQQTGALNYSAEKNVQATQALHIADNWHALDSNVSGNVWKILVEEGQYVERGQAVLILESMKMEIEIHALQAGWVRKIVQLEGKQVSAGDALMYLEEKLNAAN